MSALKILVEAGGDAVAHVAAQSPTVALPRGAEWTMSAAAGAALLAVDAGFIVLSSKIGDGRVSVSRRIILATGRGGTLLAPPALGEQIEAITDCRFTTISFESLRVLVTVPAVAEAITLALARELEERHTTIRNCAYVRHADRVREKLLQLARIYGRVVPSGVRIDFPLTHQLLADMVGSARETVSLAISELARDGLVRRQSRFYIVRFPGELLGPEDPQVAR